MGFAQLSEGRKAAIALSVVVGLLIAMVELSAWAFVNFRWHQFFMPFYSGPDAALPADPCERFILDLQLGDIHDNSAGCKVRDGAIEAGFVRYLDGDPADKPVLVTLGGSTTDGLFQYADGYSWPYWLSKISNASGSQKYTVLNGGVGGFSSSRELRKLQRDVLMLGTLPKVIVSLNGINEIKGYDGPLELTYPYYIDRQLQVIDRGRIATSSSDLGGLLPNTMFLLDKVSGIARGMLGEGGTKSGRRIDPRYEKSLPKAAFGSKAELWRYNVTTMRAVAESIGATYLVFLQPTMGLAGEDTKAMSPHDAGQYQSIGKDYLQNLNETYAGIRAECAKLDFCVDISGLLKYAGEDLYHDPRHPNAKGNKAVAQRVFDEIVSRKY